MGSRNDSSEEGNAVAAPALDYLALLAELRPERAAPAALRWHGRLELEAANLTLVESQLALAALTNLCAGDAEAANILRRLVRSVRPAPLPRVD